MKMSIHRALHPRPFEDGHALTFTLREIYNHYGEFLSQYHDRIAAAHALARARKHGVIYAELRDQDGNVIADYASGWGTQWYTYAEGGAS